MYFVKKPYKLLILDTHSGVRVNISPPMFSARYFSQYTMELWSATKKGFAEASWPGTRFFAKQGMLVFIQALISLFVVIAIYRNRQVLNDSKRWRFLRMDIH